MMDVSLEKRDLVIEMYLCGNLQKDISTTLKISQSTVSRLIAKYKNGQSLNTKRPGRCGRKRTLTSRTTRLIVRQAITNPHFTSFQIQRAVGGDALRVSTRTIRRNLRRHDVAAFRPRKSPALNKRQMMVRYRWALAHQNWSAENWSQVIFTDETYVDLSPSPKPVHFWRRRHSQCSLQHSTQHKPFLKRLLIWGSICHSGVGSMTIIAGSMTTPIYISVLQDHVLPFSEHFEIFQHDNAPAHTAKKTRSFLESNGIPVLEWPPYSPDLNIMENVWAVLKLKLRNRKLESLTQLKEAVHDIWYNDEVLQKTCKAVFQSVPRRIAACIRAKGEYTKY